MITKRTIRDLTDAEVRGKRALVRVDFNVPLDESGNVSDDTRIRAALPTIEALAARGARVVLLSHLGRPKGGKPEPKYSLAPVAKRLGELTSRPVRFVSALEGDDAVTATRELKDGEILLLENTRFNAGEEKNDDALAKALARLGDLYVNDAFGAAHRAHSSTAGVAKYLHPAVAGLLMEKELEYLGSALADPQRPFIAILGGAKISGKIDVIESLLPKVDGLLIGGAMANTFYKAMGLETGKSLVEPDRVDLAKSLLDRAGFRLTLPHDAMVAPSLEQAAGAHVVKRERHFADRFRIESCPVYKLANWHLGPHRSRVEKGSGPVNQGASAKKWVTPVFHNRRRRFETLALEGTVLLMIAFCMQARMLLDRVTAVKA